jgi:hypothetical protein
MDDSVNKRAAACLWVRMIGFQSATPDLAPVAHPKTMAGCSQELEKEDACREMDKTTAMNS